MTRQPPGRPPSSGAHAPPDERAGAPYDTAHGRAPPPRQGHKRRPPKKAGSGVLGWIAISLLCLAGLAVGAATVFVLTLPTDAVRDQITAEVKRRTGRDLVIAGPASFTFYPALGFSLSDVSLSAPAGMSQKPLVQMSGLVVSVRLLPLLSREVAVERLLLVRPVFELHVDQSGRKTWDMAGPDPAAAPVRLAQAATSLSDASSPFMTAAAGGAESDGHSGARSAGLSNIELGDVQIEGGIVRYSDARSGVRHEASAIDMRVGLASIAKPLEAKGNLTWRGERIDLDATLTSVKQVLDARPAKLELTISSRPVDLSYNGSLHVKEAIDAEGAVALKSQSVKELARWAGNELPPVPGLGPLDFKGHVRVTGKTVAISDATIALDGATGAGQVTLDAAPSRPYIKGALRLSELDLNKYVATGGSAGSGAAEQAVPAAGAKPAADPPAQSINDLLDEGVPAPAGPKVKGFTQRDTSSGWSEGQIDASALGLVDADLKLSLGGLLIDKIRIGQSLLTVALKSTALKTNLDEVQLYGGRAKGFVTLDAATPGMVAVGTNLAVEGIAAGPLLRDAASMDWLAGTGKLSLVVSGSGRSQRQIVETLTGKADFSFADGAIVGWNIPGMIRNVMQGKLRGLDKSPSEKTDFSELAASWTITNGLAENQDLRLLSPLLRVTGAGNVMLPARELDYTLRPKLVSSLEGQGADAAAKGLEIPVRVTGSWEKPKLTPDIGGVLKDPNQAVEAVKEFGKQFKGKNANEVLKGIFGDKPSGSGETGTSGSGGAGTESGSTESGSTGSTDKEKAKKLLEGLFSR